MYHTLRVGERTYDLGQPVAGNETLGHWYWRELTSKDIGAIVESLHYRMLVNKLMSGNERVATSVILDQFYKNMELPAPATEEVLSRAIQLGVQEGGFGFVIGEGEITRAMLRYQQLLPLGVISYEPGFSLLSNAVSEALVAKWREEDEIQKSQQIPGDLDDSEGVHESEDADTSEEMGGTGKDRDEITTVYHRLQLTISDVPANRIADVNRGIFLPLSAASERPLTFKLTLEVQSAEGISKATLEQKIKETIRQIGATLETENLD